MLSFSLLSAPLFPFWTHARNLMRIRSVTLFYGNTTIFFSILELFLDLQIFPHAILRGISSISACVGRLIPKQWFRIGVLWMNFAKQSFTTQILTDCSLPFMNVMDNVTWWYAWCFFQYAIIHLPLHYLVIVFHLVQSLHFSKYLQPRLGFLISK